MSRDTMVYYRSFRESLRELPPDLYKVVSETIFDYAFEGIAPGPDSNAVAKALFIAIKPVIDNAHNRYDACVENGRKGGAPKGSRNNPSGKAIQPNQRPNQYPNQEPNLYKDKDVDKDKDIESKGGAGGSGKSNVGNTPKGTSADKPRKVATKRAAFVAPSLEMVKDYFLTIKGANTDSECFYDYFTANGWRTGKNPIKDWKAAARNWMRRKSEFSNTTQIQTSYETKRIYKDL
ncbi:DUF6291 domain-containing protein [Alistipes putredinis]|jgi:hypothetical protein|uniref:DUF6291 domain-containing protein n=1 Tax=Alistipes putredinis TaxID=28117 RepID=UPI003AB430A3